MAWVIGIGVGLLLLFSFPKQMGGLIAFLVVLAIGIGGWVYIQEQRAGEARRKERESVSIGAKFDATRCSSEFPILIAIKNENPESLLSVSFSLSGFREGYSSPVYEESYLTSDAIVPPGMVSVTCWSVSQMDPEIPPDTLKWKAVLKYPTFGDPP